MLPPRGQARWTRPTAGSSARARKIAAATHLSVVRVCKIAIASSTPIAIQKSATTTIFATARASIPSARIKLTLVAESDPLIGARSRPAALVSVDFDDAPARQPGASPSPPPSGGIALGGARAANSGTGQSKSQEKEVVMNDLGGVDGPVSDENRVHIFD